MQAGRARDILKSSCLQQRDTTLTKISQTDPSKPQYHVRLRRQDAAPCALLPGNPARVDLILSLLSNPRKISSNREFLVGKGNYRGLELLVVSTGIGSPAATIALEELANVGVRCAVRVGTTASIDESMEVGSVIIPVAAVRNEGTSSAYAPPSFPAIPDPALLGLLISSSSSVATKTGVKVYVGLVSTDDAFYAEDEEVISGLRRLKVTNLDMESSALFVVGWLKGIAVASVLAVNGNLAKAEPFVEEEAIAAAEKAAAQIALSGARLFVSRRSTFLSEEPTSAPR